MIIDNGQRRRLVIDGIFEGMAGVAAGYVSFVPNMGARAPTRGTRGELDGVPIRLAPKKDASGPFYTSRYEVID